MRAEPCRRARRAAGPLGGVEGSRPAPTAAVRSTAMLVGAAQRSERGDAGGGGGGAAESLGQNFLTGGEAGYWPGPAEQEFNEKSCRWSAADSAPCGWRPLWLRSSESKALRKL